ncbi:hypothetical protein C6B38_06200 [Spiroplasma sp. ChiS]|uniref:hypothetical protein n=1 Tax=Spiroplasma sp. ChiS TaxID=2099885 RepID=UPI000CF9184F|nr:hypothetical protein [Spiroplasma sp. ChiS]PQP78407.1 hypothetical protein C6B38_06200 [Spiroplasma sp. ChiS]
MSIKKILSLIGATAITTSGVAPLMAMMQNPCSSNNTIINKNANIKFKTKNQWCKILVLQIILLLIKMLT